MVTVMSDFINKVKIINADEELINSRINQHMAEGYYVKQITAVTSHDGSPKVCILFEKPI